jgi:hypothetical protein
VAAPTQAVMVVSDLGTPGVVVVASGSIRILVVDRATEVGALAPVVNEALRWLSGE